MITAEWHFGGEQANPNTVQTLYDAWVIRRAVFMDEQGISEADEMDGTDRACAHLTVYDDGGRPAATGRVMVTGDAFTVGRVAVLPAYRKQGYGRLVMQVLVHACCAMGGEHQTLHAQLSARGFYEKLGFVAQGAVYDEAGIPHVTMTHDGECAAPCGTLADLSRCIQ